jgi:hypothetical protein
MPRYRQRRFRTLDQHAALRSPPDQVRGFRGKKSSSIRVTFTADGRMMSVVCDGRPELPVGRQPGIQLLLRQIHLELFAEVGDGMKG